MRKMSFVINLFDIIRKKLAFRVHIMSFWWASNFLIYFALKQYVFVIIIKQYILNRKDNLNLKLR